HLPPHSFPTRRSSDLATAFLGGSISVSATVRNSGAAKTGAFRVAVYLSTTATPSAVPAGAAFCIYSDGLAVGASAACAANVIIRSEEHTSELQSLAYL